MSPSKMELNEALQKCFQKGIKVYPVYDNSWRRWYIEMERNGRKKRYDKPVSEKDINESVTLTYIHLASKL